MAWTKGKLIDKAYGSFGLSRLNYTVTPEQTEEALDFLEAMMAEWEASKGLHLGYAANPDAPAAAQDSGLPPYAYSAVFLNLSLKCQDGIGMPNVNNVKASDALDALLSYVMSQNIPQVQRRRDMPRGSGNKAYRIGSGEYYYPAEQLQAGVDSFLGDNEGAPLIVSDASAGDIKTA